MILRASPEISAGSPSDHVSTSLRVSLSSCLRNSLIIPLRLSFSIPGGESSVDGSLYFSEPSPKISQNSPADVVPESLSSSPADYLSTHQNITLHIYQNTPQDLTEVCLVSCPRKTFIVLPDSLSTYSSGAPSDRVSTWSIRSTFHRSLPQIMSLRLPRCLPQVMSQKFSLRAPCFQTNGQLLEALWLRAGSE